MLGIVFEGCACRAAFHAGVAAGLAEAKMPIALAAGSSSGSLCAAGVAAGRAAELPSVWRALGGRSIVSFRRALWNRSIFDMSHLVRRTVRDALAGGDLRHGPGEALVVATRLRDLKPIVYSSREEPDLVEPLLGSCFFPVLYGRPVRVRGEWLVDGGLVDNLPLETLVARGADEVIAVVTSHEGTALKHPLRTRWRPHAAGARVHVIHPRTPLAIRSWDFDPERIARALDEGYARGREFAS
ncbi:MAG TPA: patatin-like phospholipase family protein [Polyangia bacterium]|nr:patatin-like phospholipase family protein [Polyangia bacterium]